MKNKMDIEKMKNIIIIVLVLIIVFGASFMATGVNGNNTKNDSNETENTDTEGQVSADASKAEEESKSIKEEEQKDLEEIDVARYLELREEKEPSVIYIARPTCHYCEIQSPIIKNIAYNYDLTIHYLNTDAMEGEEITKFTKSDKTFEEGFGTPCTIIVKGSKIVGKMEGLTDREEMINFFKNNGIIVE